MSNLANKEEQIGVTLSKFLTYFPYLDVKADSNIHVIIATYARELALEFDADTIYAAMTKIVKTAKFYPSFGEISQQAKSFKNHINRIEEPKTGDEAWQEALKVAQGSGREFSSEEIKKAFNAIGYRTIAYSDESSLPYIRAQFIKAYETFLKRKEDFTINENIALKLGSLNIGLIDV